MTHAPLKSSRVRLQVTFHRGNTSGHIKRATIRSNQRTVAVTAEEVSIFRLCNGARENVLGNFQQWSTQLSTSLPYETLQSTRQCSSKTLGVVHSFTVTDESFQQCFQQLVDRLSIGCLLFANPFWESQFDSQQFQRRSFFETGLFIPSQVIAVYQRTFQSLLQSGFPVFRALDEFQCLDAELPNVVFDQQLTRTVQAATSGRVSPLSCFQTLEFLQSFPEVQPFFQTPETILQLSSRLDAAASSHRHVKL